MGMSYTYRSIAVVMYGTMIQAFVCQYISVFAAMDQPFASCMMAHFQVYIFKWYFVCKFGIVKTNFLVISCLCLHFYITQVLLSCLLSNDFYSEILYIYIYLLSTRTVVFRRKFITKFPCSLWCWLAGQIWEIDILLWKLTTWVCHSYLYFIKLYKMLWILM